MCWEIWENRLLCFNWKNWFTIWRITPGSLPNIILKCRLHIHERPNVKDQTIKLIEELIVECFNIELERGNDFIKTLSTQQ